jgi:hypothetical protein
MDSPGFPAILEKGLAFLERRQMASGRFPIEVTFHYLDGSPVEQDDALFATAMIVYSLGFISRTAAKHMTERALTYFQHEMTGRGLWRYWGTQAVRNGRRLHRLIPADLDDMANISYLLERTGKSFPDNKSLFLLNRNRNGRFYTWLVPRAVWTFQPGYWLALLRDLNLARMTVFWKTTEARYDDVDAVVNANVLLYLGECQETRAVTEWLVQIIHDGTEALCDKWYRDRYSFYYALSRNHHRGASLFSGSVGNILSRLEAASCADGKIGDHVLHTALAVNSMMNLGVCPTYFDAAVDYIVAAQREDGSWESKPLYYGGPQLATSWGSPELTTGLCLEALARVPHRSSSSTRTATS